ncbi:class I SAM-dependent methyltransferase [Saccharopolyspora karakumensis]|uniref:Class I SAM-dependent methyltransferase n=1 Tax=Saccharopolyspora karakumensis TaxID=2530386 RepID=A0A4R5BG19_9PSEU|nr:class I SAM-dependent methyltransferase [Saccharopolyspora karakumensis]TDD85548.1 class I SAM-dependent methyltransferase [Saccharopolyspora karakumensis]
MAEGSATEAYGRRCAEYVELLGTIDATAAPDRELIAGWARAQPEGPLLDVGCGPGHWTNWLHEQGLDVGGVDPTPEFVEVARKRFPDVAFREGVAEQLEVADSGLAGILAWYSLIHVRPDRVPAALAEFARVVEPGGGLLVGFCRGPEVAPFDHAVTTAHFWPVDQLSDLIEEAGFAVSVRDTRDDPGARPHGAILASRVG